MTNRKLIVTAALFGATFGRAWAQAPQLTALDIEWQNAVGYIGDIADPTKYATSPTPVPFNLNVKDFGAFLAIADIVSVNGKPARGAWILTGRAVATSPSPTPGSAIADIGRGAMTNIHFEIRQTDGTTPVGTIMTSGFTGGLAPPGAASGFCNLAVTGGTGAFLGATGEVTSPGFGTRAASMAEDPANRRTNGGTNGHFIIYLNPLFRPQVVTTANGPAVVHASDSSLVTTAKPARSGEVLTLFATGLGPARPALEPGKVFSANPPQVANSPIEVNVGGQAADVLYAGGYPGSADGFQVNFRVPSGLTPGTASLQVTAAFIPGQSVSIPIQ